MSTKVSFTSEYEFADFIEGYLQDLMSYIYELAKADEKHNAIIQKFLNEVEALEIKLSDADGFEPGDDDAFANYMDIEADRQCFKEIIALLGIENFTNFQHYNTEVEYDGEVAKGPDFFAGISNAYVCSRYGYFYHDSGCASEVDYLIYDGCLFN